MALTASGYLPFVILDRQAMRRLLRLPDERKPFAISQENKARAGSASGRSAFDILLEINEPDCPRLVERVEANGELAMVADAGNDNREGLMAELTLHELSRRMAKLDFAMLAKRSAAGALTARPMSNNGDVEYHGDSYFFACDASRKISDIRADPAMTLSYTGAPEMLGGSPLFVAVEGQAAPVEDKAQFEAHLPQDLDRRFPDGIDTPGTVMIVVRADRIRYWDGGDEGEVAA
jgi:general stress protein 26